MIRIYRCLAAAVLLSAAGAAAAELPVSSAGLTVDGRLDDPVWRRAETFDLAGTTDGAPTDLAASARIAVNRGWLAIAVDCPEPGGRVLAFSHGVNPEWARDSRGMPPLEDRVRLELTGDLPLALEINPWGAVRIEREGKTAGESGMLRAARVDGRGWAVEAALPLNEVFPAGGESLEFEITRIRSLRAQAPLMKWSASAARTVSAPAAAEVSRMPACDPPEIGNTDPPLEVGYVPAVPPLTEAWDGPGWRGVRSFRLPANEYPARLPDYPTEVKWVHDGRTLAVLFRCTEDMRVDADNGAHDSGVGSDDHVFLNLASTGSSVLEIMANPAGAVRDARARGPHMYGSAAGAWDGDIDIHYDIFHDHWIVRLDIPLAEVAAGLGEGEIPRRLKAVIGRERRGRPGQVEEISALPVIGHPYLLAPVRFRGLELTRRPPAEIEPPEPPSLPAPRSDIARALAEVDPDAFTRLQQSRRRLPGMISSHIDERVRAAAMAEHAEWDSVDDLAGWEEFRDRRLRVLDEALGRFDEYSPPLDVRYTGERGGDGYRMRNVLFQSRPGDWVAANLYLPDPMPAGRLPGIVIIPSHHYPKTQGELQDCGMIWARTGCAVLVIERLGAGERTQTVPWHRQHWHSIDLAERQLDLVGESWMGWMAGDAVRGMDMLMSLDYIDPDRLILIGSVAGGGLPAAIAGFTDERIDCTVPFNFGRVYWWGWGIRRSISEGISPWFLYNAVAPRKFIYAHEFSWEGEEGPEYPSVWTPAWPRFERVYEYYGARDNLATTQGTGLLRVKETAGDCYSVGPAQREPIYHVFERWFDIPPPREEDRNIRIDSQLSFARWRDDYAAIVDDERERRMPEPALTSITPAAHSAVRRIPMHRTLAGAADSMLAAARDAREGLAGEDLRSRLADDLRDALGPTAPAEPVEAENLGESRHDGFTVRRAALHPENGITVPVMTLLPEGAANSPAPLVVAVCEQGKRGMLDHTSNGIADLLAAGVAVCIPEVRGTGETAPSRYNFNHWYYNKDVALADSPLAGRLRDLRAVLAWLDSAPEFSLERTALWGVSLAPANPQNILLDEVLTWPVGPTVQHQSSPLGAGLVLLAALYEPRIAGTVASGTISGWRSQLEDAFSYTPATFNVARILEIADIPDIASALAPRPLLVAGVVDGRNRPLDETGIRHAFGAVRSAYGNGVGLELTVERDPAVQVRRLTEILDAGR